MKSFLFSTVFLFFSTNLFAQSNVYVLGPVVGSQSSAKVTSEEVKTLSKKLLGGDYSGSYLEKSCVVSVIDNGADGSAYLVDITPTKGNGEFPAQFSISPGLSGKIGELGASVNLVNYYQQVNFKRLESGLLAVSVLSQSGGKTSSGVCYIAVP